MAHRDLREAHIARELGDLLLMSGMAVGVHEHDRDRIEPAAARVFQFIAHHRKVRHRFNRTVGAHALVDLDDAFEQHFRLDDLLGENIWARLIANFQCVPESLGSNEQRALALAFEQGVGRNRRSHLDRSDPALRDGFARLQSQQVPNALHRRVTVGAGIFREQLVCHQCPVRPPTDHVGEGAATIDPKIPRGRRGRCRHR